MSNERRLIVGEKTNNAGLPGKPLVTRIGAVRQPCYRILGVDVEWRVIAVGASATRFKLGDEHHLSCTKFTERVL